MTRRFTTEPIRIGMGLIPLLFLLGGMGCATTSDLEKVDQGLTRKLRNLDNTLQAQIQGLRRDLKNVQGSQEQLVAAITDEIDRRLLGIEHTVAEVERLPSLVSDLGTEMDALRQTLFQTYELEEAALRDRLKALEQFRRRLELVPGQQRPRTIPAPVTTAPQG